MEGETRSMSTTQETIKKTLKGIGIIRCSSKPQLEKYGPIAQRRDIEEGLGSFPQGEVELTECIELHESASKWSRKKWDAVMNRCLEYHRQGKVDVIVFPRVDRESRFLAGSFTKLIEVVKSGLLVYFAMERLWLDPDNPDSWETYLESVQEAQAYIRVLRRNTTRGKRDSALSGNISSGYGRYNGYLGLLYDRTLKKMIHVPGQIEVAKEILYRSLSGESSSQIVRDLQAKGVKGAAGGYIHRSSVSRVLHNAPVYAGKLIWNGIEIPDKVEPIITQEEAEQIAKRLAWNKEKSLGFGKRVWLTSRVFCGVCGCHYNLDSKKGCYCNKSDKRSPVKCPAPKVGLMELSALAYGTMITALSEPETVIKQARVAHENWEKQKAIFELLSGTKERYHIENEKRRRQLSVQHEYGGITDEEYLRRLNDMRCEEPTIVDEFTEPEPLTPEQVKETYDRLSIFKPLRLRFKDVLKNPRDEMADELAEKVGLKVIVGKPVNEGEKFSVQVKMNLPLEDETIAFPDELEPVASGNVVFSSSRRYEHPPPLLPAPA